MNLYSSLESYVNSQKKTCLYFLMLGFVLLGFAAYSYFFSYSDPFYQGLFLGSVSAGILIILGGLTYGSLNNKILSSVEEVYNTKKDIFLKNETIRMEKVLRNFSSFQTVFILIVILAIGVIISFKIPFASGLFLAISLSFIGIVSIEAISKYSIDTYYGELLKAHSSTFILEDVR